MNYKKKFSLAEATELVLTVTQLNEMDRRRLELIQRREAYELNRDWIIELYDKYFMYGVE